MKSVLFALLGLVGFASAAQAQLPWQSGTGAAGTPPAPFTGVGDVVAANIRGHWGLIAGSSASRGSAMISLCDEFGGNCADASTDASTGIVSSTQNRNGTCTGTLVGVVYTPGANPCVVDLLYDDSGAAAGTLTSASGPKFVPNCIGTVPCIYMGASGTFTKASGFTAITLPITMGVATATIVNSSGNDRVFSIPDASGVTVMNRPGVVGSIYNGAFMDTGSTMTLGTTYALIGDISAAGSTGGMAINGTRTAGTPGTQDAGTAVNISGAGGNCDCTMVEAVVWAAQLSGGDITSVAAAMQANGGY